MTRTVDTPKRISCEMGMNDSASASFPANVCEAAAEVKKPANVTPTWMVAKKRLESLVSLRTRLARLSPSSAILRTLLSFRVMTAISDAAKNALTKIKIISRIMENTEKDDSAWAGWTLVDSGHKWPAGFRRHK